MKINIIKEAINELRNEARERYDLACLMRSAARRNENILIQSKLIRLSNELEDFLKQGK